MRVKATKLENSIFAELDSYEKLLSRRIIFPVFDIDEYLRSFNFSGRIKGVTKVFKNWAKSWNGVCISVSIGDRL